MSVAVGIELVTHNGGNPDGEQLLAGIRDDPWDLTRLLVYADWLQENGEDDWQLRFAVRAWKVVLSVPEECTPATEEQRNKLHNRLEASPHADVLCRVAAVAFVRRPKVWGQLTDRRSTDAVGVAWLLACGLASDDERAAARAAAWDAAEVASRDDSWTAAWWEKHRAAYWAAARDAASAAEVASRVAASDAEVAYQAEVYRRLHDLSAHTEGRRGGDTE